ncbi:MAG TPA: TylF/MycF/NovP-related O-methyltransferase [Thermoleophilaceae bacterium]|nr:TylF/MycF/NovP-related O-methyltransferase [Thermoleophilaceae bacterium]
MSSAIRRLLGRRGGGPPAEASGLGKAPDLGLLSAADRRVIERALPLTMTGAARLLALIDAVRYCVARELEGDFAECGVWRGGSVVAIILVLQELGVEDRDIHLFDTFEGMTRPTEHDVSPIDPPALETWNAAETGRAWPELFDPEHFNEEAVRETVLDLGYPADRIHFVRGPVEKTLPRAAPEHLALLRLDTDWYESTRHELEHLYPRLVQGGVLIVDDYGHWEGARRAVDEYFLAQGEPLLLNRIDYTARIAVKQ